MAGVVAPEASFSPAAVNSLSSPSNLLDGAGRGEVGDSRTPLPTCPPPPSPRPPPRRPPPPPPPRRGGGAGRGGGGGGGGAPPPGARGRRAAPAGAPGAAV